MFWLGTKAPRTFDPRTGRFAGSDHDLTMWSFPLVSPYRRFPFVPSKDKPDVRHHQFSPVCEVVLHEWLTADEVFPELDLGTARQCAVDALAPTPLRHPMLALPTGDHLRRGVLGVVALANKQKKC